MYMIQHDSKAEIMAYVIVTFACSFTNITLVTEIIYLEVLMSNEL